MKCKIKKFGFEVRESFTATIQIDKRLKTMQDQYKIKMGQVNDPSQLFKVVGERAISFEAVVLRWEYMQNSMLLKIKVTKEVIKFMSNIVSRGIEEVGIEFK